MTGNVNSIGTTREPVTMSTEKKEKKKKKISTTNSRNYKYGLLPPIKNGDKFDEQVSEAHKYKNALCRIERDRRVGFREIARTEETDAVQAKIDAKVDELKEVNTEIKKIRAQARNRKTSPIEAARAKKLKTEIKVLNTEFKVLRNICKNDPEIAAKLEENNELANTRAKEAYKTSSLYWGTRGVCDRAAKAARSEPTDPQFRHWDGTGLLGIQLQGGRTMADLADDTYTQIDTVSEEAYLSPIRGDRRRLCRTTVRLRIGTDENNKPIFAEFPGFIHRPIPSDSRITWAYVKKSRCGDRYVYSLILTVAREKGAGPIFGQSKGTGKVGVDIGWRLLPDDSLRVAYWKDGKGKSGELILDPSFRKANKKIKKLRENRDKNLDVMRPLLVAMFKTLNLPEWMVEQTSHMGLWKSTNRFAKLGLAWRGKRFDGDAQAFALMDEWRRQNKHLLDWEMNLQDKIQGRRREQYRIFAARLAETYAAVNMENFDLRKIAIGPKVEEKGDNQTARYHRQIASVSTLRDAIKNACSTRGVIYKEVVAAFTTKICYACGSVERWDQEKEVVHTCSQCNLTWDQDKNAADNILNDRGIPFTSSVVST